MKKFEFKLEPLLQQRGREEDEKRRAMAVLERKRLDIENQIRSIQHKITNNKNELYNRLSGVVDSSAIRAQAAMTNKLDAEARRLVLQLVDLHKSIDKAHTALMEAVTKRKSLQRLREMRLEAWQHELNQTEARELDDMVTMRYSRPI